MKYVKFGNTGLEVSRICLGCMSFGEPDRGMNQWTLDEEKSREVIKHALDLGINFFDTANQYSNGSSEEIVGRALKDFANRDEIVIASKLYYSMYDGPNSKGLSRKCIMREIDKTLERLQTDYLDLYIIHRLDHDTPIEETMEALHDLVKSGKVRYIGASSMYAWQFSKCQYIAEKNGWTKFVSMQDLQNLLYREEEREMISLCKDLKVAMTPWSPLSGGRLVRDPDSTTTRSKTQGSATNNSFQEEGDKEIIKRVAQVAKDKGISKTQVALAWLLSKDYITAPIVGATKSKYLDDAIGALSVSLTPEEITYLEEPYITREIAYFR